MSSKVITVRDGIKAVLFDLGNVLLFFSHERMFEQIAAALNCERGFVEDYLKAKGNLHRFETGLLTEEEFLEELCKACAENKGAFPNPAVLGAKIRQAMCDIFHPNQNMIDLLTILKDKVLKLILVSNTSSIHFESVKKCNPWLDIFDAFVLSYEVKAMKPDQQYYAAAQRIAGVPAANCLFIDDIPENIAGAEKAGFQTILYKDHDNFLQNLARQTQ